MHASETHQYPVHLPSRIITAGFVEQKVCNYTKSEQYPVTNCPKDAITKGKSCT